MTENFSPAHAALLDTVPAGSSRIVARDISYQSDGTPLQGYLAVDESAAGLRPGVLVIHDWLGVWEYVKVRAQMLARLGYVAFAPDIFGVRPDETTAPAIAGRYYRDPELMRARGLAGLAQLQAQQEVDRARMSAIGYCFGGAVALSLAAAGAELRGVVSFHGALVPVSPADAARVVSKILLLGGAADPVVPDDAVRAYENSLRVAPHIDWQHTRYANAMHAFTLPEADSPDHGAQFNPTAERRSWIAMRNFFDEIFAS